MAESQSETLAGKSLSPSTPPPPVRTKSADSMIKSVYTSPPPVSGSMTPPPSTQPPRFQSPIDRSSEEPTDTLPASPPTTAKSTALHPLPTPDSIDKADVEELRRMVRDLVLAVRDARTAAAHFKLQHSLLTMESEEAAQRAEVEHQMMKREIEVLQAAEHRKRASSSMSSRGLPPAAQSHIDALHRACRTLEEERDEADHRLSKAQKRADIEKDRCELLAEENARLKKRIRENREHFTRIKSLSPSYTTPRDAFTTPQRKTLPQFPQSAPNRSNIAALLAADQVLSGESLSVQSTPTRIHTSRFKHGHIRGAHSLSSLHTTPAQTRPITRDDRSESTDPFSVPASQLVIDSAERERTDRDSTISVSDEGEEGDDDQIEQSHASSLASDMLRKNPGSQESLRLSQGAERSSTLLQTKLFGPTQKSGKIRKRVTSSGEVDTHLKKPKVSQGVGLGIESWSQ